MRDLVCIHASASSGRQWRALARRLDGRYRVHAPDLYSSGDSPQWPAAEALSLADELDLLEPLLQRAAPFDLVGHSYGGVVALHAALAAPERVRSLVIFEPVLFGLLGPDRSDPEILAVRDETAAAVERGDLDAAGERFIDYWMGPGAWARMPEPRQQATSRAMPGVTSQFDAIFAVPAPPATYATLATPTLLLTANRSPVAARTVARLLADLLPNVTLVELDGVGHMAPVTHPDTVNEAIDKFLTG
jgi:pimeloyl-ACP methyl ester carboxylesterase